MSIATAITEAQGKVANAYTAVSNMGGTLPATQNLSNLPTAIESISTVNNQDITITANGEYTAAEGYTGIGTATVDLPLGIKAITANGLYIAENEGLQGYSMVFSAVPEPDFVSATNTTGTAISADNKVWLEKVSGGWNIVKHLDALNPFNSLNKVGSPTITDDYVVSGFSSSNYFTGTNTETIDGFDTLHCTSIIKFNSGSLQSNNSYLFGSNFAPAIQLSNSLLYWNGSSLQGIFTPSANTDYWLKMEVSGTSVSFYHSTDGENYTLDTTGTVSDMTSSSIISIGNIGYASYVARPFAGSIDFKEFKVFNENGTLVWQPVKNNIFTGASEEAIASSATGNVRTVLSGYIAIEVTADADNAQITAV